MGASSNFADWTPTIVVFAILLGAVVLSVSGSAVYYHFCEGVRARSHSRFSHDEESFASLPYTIHLTRMPSTSTMPSFRDASEVTSRGTSTREPPTYFDTDGLPSYDDTVREDTVARDIEPGPSNDEDHNTRIPAPSYRLYGSYRRIYSRSQLTSVNFL